MQLSLYTNKDALTLSIVRRCKVPAVTVCISGRQSPYSSLVFWKASKGISVVLRHLHKISRKGSSDLWWEGEPFLTMIFLVRGLGDKFKHLTKLFRSFIFKLIFSSMLSPMLSLLSSSFPSSRPLPCPPSLPFLLFLLFFLLLLHGPLFIFVYSFNQLEIFTGTN